MVLVVPNSSSNNSNSGTDGRSVHRSAIILGIIGVQEPDTLSRSITKHVAESLVALLLDGKRNIFRLAAVELMGRGYPIWLPFIHGASILKLLLSWLIQLHGGDEQFYQTTLKAIIHILTTTNESTAASINETGVGGVSVSTLSIRAASPSTSSVESISRKSSSSALANHKTWPLITWLNDLNSGLQGSREVSQIERKCSIEILKNLLPFKPINFRGHEQLLVEVVMKLVEPENPIYEELTCHFGVISVHPGTHRIAVSSSDNTISVYDMKSGKLIVLLQGHVHPCTLVAFNPEKPDGKQIISYSAGEACFRWWNTMNSLSNLNSNGATISGIFSSLTGANNPELSFDSSSSNRPGLKPVKVIIVQPELTEAIDCIPNGSIFKLNPINLKWNLKNKIVEFRVGASLIQTITIPSY